jgi:hypothetical protein
MKARNEIRKPVKEDLYGSEELKRARKLKPIKKEKNQKQTLFQEIDELEDIDLDYRDNLFDDDDNLEDEIDEEEDDM